MTRSTLQHVDLGSSGNLTVASSEPLVLVHHKINKTKTSTGRARRSLNISKTKQKAPSTGRARRSLNISKTIGLPKSRGKMSTIPVRGRTTEFDFCRCEIALVCLNSTRVSTSRSGERARENAKGRTRTSARARVLCVLGVLSALCACCATA